ncbi:hypothetical protein [Sphingomonas sp. Mn802worker]|nr:hypothetical protein [Sphingomonas sp. Mn802worker]
MTDAARGTFQRSLGTLGDHACEMVPTLVQDYFPDEPKDCRDAT